MKRDSKQFLALFMAVAMSVTPVSYAYAEDSAVAGVENTESGQQTVEVTDGEIGAADATGQPAEEVTGQEEETTAGQGTDENQKSQEEPKAGENATTGNVTEAEKKEAGEDGKSEEKAAEEQKVKSKETAGNAGEVKAQEAGGVESNYGIFNDASSSVRVVDNQLEVTLTTASVNYGVIYIGKKEAVSNEAGTVDEDKVVKGTKKDSGYEFVFRRPIEEAGQKISFVPGDKDKSGEYTWYTEKDCFLTIPKLTESGKDDEEKPGQGGNSGESKPGTGSGEEQKPGNENKNVLDTGKYVVDVDAASASGMFRVVNCVLTSVGGKMQADITLSGTGYDKLYMGSKEAAASASKDQLIGYSVNAEGKYVFTVPVESMNTGIRIAAHGKKSDKWYDRTLTFKTEGMTKYVQVSDGSYKVNVTSSSSMFKVTNCILTSKDGNMTAKITLSGTGYEYLYVGTSAEAALADKSKWIPYVVDENGRYTYTIPVSLLDTGISVAAFSHKNQLWYDRTLTFVSDSMQNLNNNNSTNGNTGNNSNTNQNNNSGNGNNSGNTGTNQTPDKESKYEADLNGGTARVNSATTLADGVYTPDKFSWSGGTGKVSISCTKITVTGGQAYATIVFSSGSYGYVKANGNTYYPTATGSTSTFVIPVELNKNNTIIGMTTKMSTAHEISYSIFIYLSAAAKADGTTVSGETNLSADTLDEKAPEIMGLSYQSETKVEHAEYFKIYHYDQGITLLEIDQKQKNVKEDSKSTESTDKEDTADSGLTPAQEEQLALYKAKIVRYLIVPEDAEIPAGLDKEMIVIQKPKKSAYVGSEEVLEILDKLNATDQITSVGVKQKNCKVEGIAKAMKAKKIIYAGTYKKPENKKLMKSKCDLAILSNKILPDEKNEKKMSVEDQQKRYEELAEKFVLLDVPMIVDRSADEEKDDAKAEWSKVYEAVFGLTDSADSATEN